MLYAVGMFQLQLRDADIHVGYLEQPATVFASQAICFLALAKRECSLPDYSEQGLHKSVVSCMNVCSCSSVALCTCGTWFLTLGSENVLKLLGID